MLARAAAAAPDRVPLAAFFRARLLPRATARLMEIAALAPGCGRVGSGVTPLLRHDNSGAFRGEAMTASLSSPALHRPRPRIAIIGAGPGGLAAAMLLAASGARVTVFEKDEVVGGRTRTLTTSDGYRFDLGPTFFLYPRILQEIFRRCGSELEAEVELRKLDPQYRLVFEGAGGPTQLDASSDLDRMEAEIAKFSPGDAKGLRTYIRRTAPSSSSSAPCWSAPSRRRATWPRPT
jgi:phytoene desaturase